MSTLINIDNGGTLTDVVVIARDDVHRVKTLTTPSDLSQCFFDGLGKASEKLYGESDVARLLADCELIRYSTTQGTNALVQRRGPRLGLLTSSPRLGEDLRAAERTPGLLDALVGARIARVSEGGDDEALRADVVAGVNGLTRAGSSRIVVCLAGPGYAAAEKALKRLVLDAFPSHLLGSVPLGFSHEIAGDDDEVRRAWTAILNAYLHPAMERFLFHADHRLRQARVATPLLVFRNDGGAARVAKTPALRSYSSGPRGGLEGIRALAAHHELADVVSFDVGGTTTDVGRVSDGVIRERRRGIVEGVATSFPLADQVSVGVGGGSILRVRGGVVEVGPESVGAAPGPACFALGGRSATITDALLVHGLLDPETYFGGALRLDVGRAEQVIAEEIAAPLGVDVPGAVAAMIAAWTAAVAAGIAVGAPPREGTVLAAFGGAGPLLAAQVAERLAVGRVLVPRAAAVFSAYGIAFSSISHEYHGTLSDPDPVAVRAVRDELLEHAERDMLAEGVTLAQCEVTAEVLAQAGEFVRRIALDAECRGDQQYAAGDTLAVRVAKHARPPAIACAPDVVAAVAATRTVDGQAVPLHRVESLGPGTVVDGPAVVEEELFTASLPEGWHLRVSPNGDLWLERSI